MKPLNLLFLIVLISTSSFATIRYVTPTGAGNQDGTSWINAAPGESLQSIIDASAFQDEIWLTCGTYTPTNTTDRTISFSMKTDVAIYGSFLGTETVLSQRAFSCGPCSILSGEIGIAGITDNSYKVVSNEFLPPTAILDGFVIRDANDDRTPSNTGNGLGGGIYNHGLGTGGFCHPTIRNCVFTNNFASFGAGAFNNGYQDGLSLPYYINCIFQENHAYVEAGAMDNYGVGGNASPTIINTLFYGNTSATNVGGMYAWGGNAGGNSHPVLVNCVFANNSALNGYGGAFIADNSDQTGGTSSGACTVTIRNSVVWNNSATADGPQFYIRGNGAEVIATYSDIDLSGQVAPHVISGSGTGNLNTNPQFVNILNALGADNCWMTSDDGLHLQNVSPLINAGNSTGATTEDILGMPHSGNPDMGAYEYQPSSQLMSHHTTDFTIYPNPASNELNIKPPDKLEHRIQLYDIYGKVLKSETIVGHQIIHISDFPIGLYLVKIDGNSTLKFIKK